MRSDEHGIEFVEKRLMKMLLAPDFVADGVLALDPGFLERNDIRGVIVDLDNTIVPRNTDFISDDIGRWIDVLKESDIGIVIASNNWEHRAVKVGQRLSVPIIAPAKKPLRSGYRAALKMMEVGPENALVVGDQLFTDILGGNRMRLLTVLVRPLASGSDLPHTRILRIVERLVLSWLSRRGRIRSIR